MSPKAIDFTANQKVNKQGYTSNGPLVDMESCEGQGIPKRLHVACAFTIYFGDVICKLAVAFENSAGNNRAEAHDIVSPGEPQSY